MDRVLEWAKLLFPIAIAGIGWYVSTIIGPLETRLHALEKTIDRELPSLVEHKLTSDNIFQDWQRQASMCRSRMDKIEDRLREIQGWSSKHEIHHAEEKLTYKSWLQEIK